MTFEIQNSLPQTEASWQSSTTLEDSQSQRDQSVSAESKNMVARSSSSNSLMNGVLRVAFLASLPQMLVAPGSVVDAAPREANAQMEEGAGRKKSSKLKNLFKKKQKTPEEKYRKIINRAMKRESQAIRKRQKATRRRKPETTRSRYEDYQTVSEDSNEYPSTSNRFSSRVPERQYTERVRVQQEEQGRHSIYQPKEEGSYMSEGSYYEPRRPVQGRDNAAYQSEQDSYYQPLRRERQVKYVDRKGRRIFGPSRDERIPTSAEDRQRVFVPTSRQVRAAQYMRSSSFQQRAPSRSSTSGKVAIALAVGTLAAVILIAIVLGFYLGLHDPHDDHYSDDSPLYPNSVPANNSSNWFYTGVVGNASTTTTIDKIVTYDDDTLDTDPPTDELLQDNSN